MSLTHRPVGPAAAYNDTAARVIHAEAAVYERFTDRARKVMRLANQEAQCFNHEYVGTEHILLGLVREESGVAAKVLQEMGVDLRRVRLGVEQVIRSGPAAVKPGKLPQTPFAKRAIEHAIAEARYLQNNYVGTEHLLLGLLRQREGVAAQVLTGLLLESSRVRRAVLRRLGHLEGPDPSGGAPDRAGARLDSFSPTPEQRILSGEAPDTDRARLEALRARVRTVQRQLAGVRFWVGSLLGAAAGGLIAGPVGALLGQLAGSLLALWGRFFPAAVAGAIAGTAIGSARWGDDAGAAAGAVIGGLLAGAIAEIGRPSGDGDPLT
jgi:hypothetical protein